MSFASSLGRGKDKDRQHDTRGCREAGSSRRPSASAPGGRQWLSHHGVTARVSVRTGRDTLLLCTRLYFVFSKFFNHPNFEIRIGVLPDVQNSPNFVGLPFET
jgi:hypothetical protein